MSFAYTLSSVAQLRIEYLAGATVSFNTETITNKVPEYTELENSHYTHYALVMPTLGFGLGYQLHKINISMGVQFKVLGSSKIKNFMGYESGVPRTRMYGFLCIPFELRYSVNDKWSIFGQSVFYHTIAKNALHLNFSVEKVKEIWIHTFSLDRAYRDQNLGVGFGVQRQINQTWGIRLSFEQLLFSFSNDMRGSFTTDQKLINRHVTIGAHFKI